MENEKEIRRSNPRPWGVTLASLLPLWLLSYAVSAEGFPPSRLPFEIYYVSFAAALILAVVLLFKGWLPVELLLFSALPYYLLYVFDEISRAYKTPFILMCALILSAGGAAYQRSRAPRLVRVVFLLIAAGAMLAMAWHASMSFWHMTDDLGYVRCFPDYTGCPPLTGSETPWWELFWRVW